MQINFSKSSILLIKCEKLKKGSSDKIIKKQINPGLPEFNISQISNIAISNLPLEAKYILFE